MYGAKKNFVSSILQGTVVFEVSYSGQQNSPAGRSGGAAPCCCATIDSVDSFNTHITNQHMTGPELPKIPDSLHRQELEAMHYIAKLKESADKLGIGFIGGFVAPNGNKYIVSNMDDDDQQLLLPEHLK